MSEIRFIAVVGPTGSGKTALGVELAKALNVPVISADSQLVYQGLDIGTGKPTLAETQNIPHFMMDLVLPSERYTVAEYREAAKPLIDKLNQDKVEQKRKTPIVVGGTGLYIRALLDPPMAPEVPPNPKFRAGLTQWMTEQGEGDAGMLALHQKLEEQDPRRASEIHFRNVVRVLRALEIIEATGNTVPEMGQPNMNEILWIGLTYAERDNMRQRINARIQAMLDTGWVEEVRRLINQYGPNAHALQTAMGYPELVDYCQGKRTLESAVEQIQINTHQYARRQLTWYRQPLFQNIQDDRMHWFEIDQQPFDSIIASALKLVSDLF